MAKNGKDAAAPLIEVDTKTVIGTIYSQLASVTATDYDITIEFAYFNPRSKKGELVGRVTMPRLAGEALAKVIIDIVAKHEATKKVKK